MVIWMEVCICRSYCNAKRHQSIQSSLLKYTPPSPQPAEVIHSPWSMYSAQCASSSSSGLPCVGSKWCGSEDEKSIVRRYEDAAAHIERYHVDPRLNTKGDSVFPELKDFGDNDSGRTRAMAGSDQDKRSCEVRKPTPERRPVMLSQRQ